MMSGKLQNDLTSLNPQYYYNVGEKILSARGTNRTLEEKQPYKASTLMQHINDMDAKASIESAGRSKRSNREPDVAGVKESPQSILR
jgi:hypothetical protein